MALPYFHKNKPELKNWYKDRYQRMVVQRRMLMLLTLASLSVSVLTVMTIMQLIPLKTIEPYVIQIDPKSGITQAIDPADVKALTTNEAVNNYFLVEYLRAREGYNPLNLEMQYNRVRLMSDGSNVYNEFLRSVDPNNAASNVARLGNSGVREIKIKTITYLNPQVVQIRFLIQQKISNRETKEFNSIALMKFEYVKMNLSLSERYLNPLGFRVLDYRLMEDQQG